MARTRYAGFDVTTAKEAWDGHTRAIVMERVESAQAGSGAKGNAPRFLTGDEAETLAAVFTHLLCEDRDELIRFVVDQTDQVLAQNPAESERKATVPPVQELVRKGLAALDAAAKRRHWKRFAHCRSKQQVELLADLQKGILEPQPEWARVPEQDLFKKLLSLAVDAYASHPLVWCEIGYAGPAYPRGYYRIERGRRDPWEPQFAGKRE